MSETSQNGWPALTSSNSPYLCRWVIPAKNGSVVLPMRNGSAGFVLAHMALWWAERIEPLAGKIADDWGWAYRPVRGQTTGLSNHSSGTAADLNATAHGRGVPLVNSFSALQVMRIRLRLRLTYRGAIRWGGDYQNAPTDGMHIELNLPLSEVERVARRLMSSSRGKRLLAANPGQAKVILS